MASDARTYGVFAAVLGEEVEAHAFLDATGTSSTLGSVRARDKRLDKAADLALLVVAHLAMLAAIYHACDVGNRHTRLGQVG